MCVALTFSSSLEKLEGTIAVQEMELADDGTALPVRTVKHMPISYQGAAMGQMNLVFDAPGLASAYRLNFYTSDPANPIAADELLSRQTDTEVLILECSRQRPQPQRRAWHARARRASRLNRL